jgi:3-dehydroquinate dehydratase
MNPLMEMAEIRVDLLADKDNLEVCFERANALNIRTIATVRDELGFTDTRLGLMLRCLEARCTLCDIEVGF